jgi:hypothetical protein
MDRTRSTLVNRLPAGSRSASLALGAALVLSFGLPWHLNAGSAGAVIPGYYVPGGCYIDYDIDGFGTSICDPGFVGAPIFLAGTDGTAISGRSHPARFGLAAAVVSLLLAHHFRQRRWLALGGLAVIVIGVPSAGLTSITTGTVLGLGAAVAMVVTGLGGASALRHPGALRSTPRR